MPENVVLEQPLHVKGADQPKTSVSDQPAIQIVEPEAPSGPTPEEALAASRKAIQAAEDQTRAARQREQQTAAQLEQMRHSQQQDQTAVLTSAVEASTAERERHSHAWQAAMEAGDWSAAAKHNSDLAMATARLERASGELAMLKAGAKRQQDQPRQQDSVSRASQDWINSHPEFSRHRDALVLKHQELVNDGVQVDSPRYFRELDTEYGRLTEGGQRQQNGGRQVADRQQFDGAPPSRGGSGEGGQGHKVRTLLGDVYVRQVGEQRFIQIPQHIRADFDEGAKVVGMSVAEYADEQVKIAQERAAGGSGGLIQSEGNTYR